MASVRPALTNLDLDGSELQYVKGLHLKIDELKTSTANVTVVVSRGTVTASLNTGTYQIGSVKVIGNLDTSTATGEAISFTLDPNSDPVQRIVVAADAPIYDVYRAADCTIYNVALTTASTEYSQALPSLTKSFAVSIHDGLATNNYRVAFVTGKVATPTAPYLKYAQNVEYTSPENVLFDAKTVYLASSTASVTAQIECWT